MQIHPPLKERRIDGVLSVVLAAVTGALGLINWLILRSFINIMLPVTSISHWSYRAIDNFTFVLFGMGWLVLVLFSQHYYYKGAGKRVMWHRFARITGYQLLLWAACQWIPLFVGVGFADSSTWIWMSVQTVGGAVFLYLGTLKSGAAKSK